MIAWMFVAPAFAGVDLRAACAQRTTQVAVGSDVLSLTAGRGATFDGVRFHAEPVDPSWYGYGWDQQASWGLGRCFRVGVREQVIWHNLALDDSAGLSATEWNLITEGMLGAEVPLGPLSVGGYALPGIRAVVSDQHADLAARSLHADYHHVSFVPTLYVYGVARIYVWRGLGVHVDTQLPVVRPMRELGWFPGRLVGAGIDVRWGASLPD